MDNTRESADLQLHLRECNDCRMEFAKLTEAFAMLPHALKPAVTNVQFTEKVWRRIRSNDPEQTGDLRDADLLASPVADGVVAPTVDLAASGTSLSLLSRCLSYALAASLLIAFLGTQYWYLKRTSDFAIAARDPSQQERQDGMEQSMAAIAVMESKSREADVQFVSFRREVTGADSTGQDRAFGVLDKEAAELHFFGFEIEPLPAGQTYALWFVSDEAAPQFVHAFNAASDRTASLVVDLAEWDIDFAMPQNIVVTIESDPVGDRPSDSVWLQSGNEQDPPG